MGLYTLSSRPAAASASPLRGGRFHPRGLDDEGKIRTQLQVATSFITQIRENRLERGNPGRGRSDPSHPARELEGELPGVDAGRREACLAQHAAPFRHPVVAHVGAVAEKLDDL
jgi:hypothetical protein